VASAFPGSGPTDSTTTRSRSGKKTKATPERGRLPARIGRGTRDHRGGAATGDSFLNFAVEHDLPETTVSKAIQWFNDQATEAHGPRDAALKDGDKASKQAATEAQQDLWEDQFDNNLAVATAGLKGLPESLQKTLRAARGPDGRKLLHDPEMAQLLFDLGARTQESGGGSDDDDGKALTGQQDDLRRELDAITT
jgi:hypothetical protein